MSIITLTSVRAVAEYLSDIGYSVSKSTVANHVKSGKLKRRSKNAPFEINDVDKYAAKFLNEEPDKTEEIAGYAATEAEAKVKLAKAKARYFELKVEKEEGRLVDKGDYDRRLASQTLAFYHLLKTYVNTESTDLIDECKGDKSMLKMFQQKLLRGLELVLSDFSKDCNWELLEQEGYVKIRSI